MDDFLNGMSVTLATIFGNFANYYGSIADLMGDVAILLSFVFAVIALVKLKGYAQNPDQNPMLHVVMLFLVAGILANFGLATTVAGNTVFGSDYNFLSYTEIKAGNGSQLTENGLAIAGGVVGFIQLIGFFAFFKGVMMLRTIGRPGDQPGSMGRSLVFLGAGVLGVNILTFLGIVSASLGMCGVYQSVFGGFGFFCSG